MKRGDHHQIGRNLIRPPSPKLNNGEENVDFDAVCSLGYSSCSENTETSTKKAAVSGSLNILQHIIQIKSVKQPHSIIQLGKHPIILSLLALVGGAKWLLRGRVSLVPKCSGFKWDLINIYIAKANASNLPPSLSALRFASNHTPDM